ncbi:hypothetical protein [Paenibacillus algicola]|uniref:hypothetical protein n=1 Tax=Paenibacillus algicola TaxID=2565926 RepID=UPI001C2FABBA|nr:hypothetical protein [Paenibacillus algicola]
MGWAACWAHPAEGAESHWRNEVSAFIFGFHHLQVLSGNPKITAVGRAIRTRSGHQRRRPSAHEVGPPGAGRAIRTRSGHQWPKAIGRRSGHQRPKTIGARQSPAPQAPATAIIND